MEDCETVTEAVVVAVADAEDISPIELPPLYDVVETDALNRLFDAARKDESASSLELCFYYSDSIVTVTGDGTIDVAPRQPVVESTAAHCGTEEANWRVGE